METQFKQLALKLATFLLAGLAVLLFIHIFTLLQPLLIIAGRIFLPFLIAGLITYLLHPVVEFLENQRIPRALSILIIYSLFLAGFVWILLRGTPYILKEGQELLDQLPYMSETYRSFVNTIHEQTETLPSAFQERADSWVENVEIWIAESLEHMGGLLKQLFDWLLLLIVIPFLVFYLLKDIKLLKKISWYLTPDKYRHEGAQMIKEIDHSLGNYIRGQLIVCAVVGILAYIGFLLINMPYAVLLAVFIGFTNIIPYFGPIIGTVPVLFIALTESVELVALALAVTVAVQLVESNLLAPVIVGKTLHMHPVLIIFALVAGGELAGIAGLILSVPLLTVIKVILLHVRGTMRKRRGVY
ncbi:AI-2E family transporter [Evansella sp. LMS18]|uniref:AI-2E family transporter n=1 Tax=Evansella sp. LMS18 TaxID=2924033 RepID=UPI0020D02863|nr:AI-2E family transporter [Evansella sp. LMS18]UTR09287.1 AI-2E family transporter [Evansella sp. LMS18]